MMRKLFFNHLLLPHGWERNAVLTVGRDGDIRAVETGVSSDGAECFDVGLPGVVNAHSHAFQRTMAGLAEYRGGSHDTFWTWRDAMYRFATILTPEDQRVISAYLQVELLKQGFTSLAEFHYLHNRQDGSPYACRAEMSLATIEAAKMTGMGLTHLPVLYMTAGFDGAPLSSRQGVFRNDVGTFLDILETVDKAAVGNANIAVGVAAHSLRAVPAQPLSELVAAHRRRNASSPFHIHIAEQTGEVEDCLKHRGQRPVEWLLDHADVDSHWTLVHATHVTADEIAGLANCRAIAAICPTTEGNLGDGIFPLPDFLGVGGRIAIGTDSHVSVSPWEELRWLEYVQRLVHRSRNIGATAAVPHTGVSLFMQKQRSAPDVTGRNVGHIVPGARADLIVLDNSAVQFEGRTPDQQVDTAIFGGMQNPVSHVMVGGEWVVRDGRHAREETLSRDYQAVLKRLMRQL